MRRALPLALALLLLAPGASASGLEVEGARSQEGVLVPGGATTFDVPLLAREAGVVYAKVLPAPDNAVNDGMRANGSVENGTGWRVAFSLLRADGARAELGERATSAATSTAALAAAERATLRIEVRAPQDAVALGGPAQSVFVAVAFRPAAAGAGEGSGASMDWSTGLALGLRADAAAAAPDPEDAPVAPPVAEIPEDAAPRVTVVQAAPPAWAMGLLALALAGVTLALAAAAVAGFLVWRELRALRGTAIRRIVPVESGEPARSEPLPAREQPPRR